MPPGIVCRREILRGSKAMEKEKWGSKLRHGYGLAWLFHFKMSPNTAMKAQRLRNGSTFFSPVESSFELSVGKAISDAGCGATFLTTSLYKSRVLLTSASTAYPSALLITQLIHGRNNTECLPVKKKINILDQYPIPNPPYTSCAWPILYTPRVTQLLKLHML